MSFKRRSSLPVNCSVRYILLTKCKTIQWASRSSEGASAPSSGHLWGTRTKLDFLTGSKCNGNLDDSSLILCQSLCDANTFNEASSCISAFCKNSCV